MKKVLIVDYSNIVRKMLQKEFDRLDDVEIVYADSYKATMKILEENHNYIHVALLDINLPDAPNGEVVTLANSYNIPTIVLTSKINDEIEELLNKKDVQSYVLKGTPKSTKLALKSVQRELLNYDSTMLIVDDSKLYRKILSDILKKSNINVLEAENGQEALDLLNKSKEKISIVFTDFEMPVMDGLKLTIKIRESYDKDQLSIIAISSKEDKGIINKFLKFGANDYITKPFTKDEVIPRMISNLDLLDLFNKIRNMANKDFLTDAYNRRYFFESGEAIFLKAKRKDRPIAVVMLDIDLFKKINDTNGHDIGDIAIKEIKIILDKNLRVSDLIARFGGEEFCIVLEDISEENTKKLFEKIRKAFEDNVIDVDEEKIKYTVSFGIAYGVAGSLEDMVKLSDDALYDSKENGRNQVTLKHT
jgi:diguanylate cyclase (GGDEF)-like protein